YALPGIAPAEALHTFMFDSGASHCFFRDSTSLTPLPAPVPIRLADPSGDPILARSSTVLLCPAVPSGSLSGLHLPSFSMNLVSTAALQDAMVTTTTLGGQRVSICTCTRTGRDLAKFTHQPGSSLYTLDTKPPQVAASAQVSALGPVTPPCSCRLSPHQTLLWHHSLGHPSLPHLRGMHFRLLVSGLPRSLPPLPPSPAPPCVPCVEGQQHAIPHSSSFPPTTGPLQTLHMDVKGEVPDVLIPWIRAVRLQLCERFRQDLPVLRLHSDREFSSDLLQDFCRGEGILESFTLPASPQTNGIAEHRIGLVMEVARMSMIHAAAPHVLWPFADRYVAHQLNLWPRVSLPETSPTQRWMGKVGDASVFRVWGSRAFIRDTSADKLSTRAIPCVFLGFPHDVLGWQFYHPTSRRVLPSQDVTFEVSVPFYRLFPYHSAPLPPPPLFLAPGPTPVDPLPPQGPAPSGVSQIDPLLGIVPVEVAVDSGTARAAAFGGAEPARAEPEGAEPAGAEPGGAESEGAGSGGAKLGGAEPGGTEPRGLDPRGAEREGAESGGAESRGTASFGGLAGASLRMSPRPEPLSPQLLRDWFDWRTRLRIPAGAGSPEGAGTAGPGGACTRGNGAARAGGAGGARAGDPGAAGAGAGGTGAVDPGARGTGAVEAGGVGGAGVGGAGVGGTGAGGARAGDVGAGGAGAGGAGAGDPGASAAEAVDLGAGGAGDTVQRCPFFVSPPPSSLLLPDLVLRQVLSLPSSTGLLSPPPCHSQPQLQPDSPLPAPSRYVERADSLTERREPEYRPASPVCTVRTGRRVPRPRPPPVPSTHVMALPSFVTDPSFESTAASALVAKLVDFAAACCLDNATSLLAESESDCPPSIGGE
ncbi:unnamed protein product, partial [Closterium sp. NIES-53]